MKTFILPVILIIITALVTYFSNAISKDRADLRYTLSEPIPTKFSGSSPSENVQQLIVRNNGNILAQRIQIKINKPIVECSILKNSESDSFEEHKNKENIEIIYPSLPPDSQFSCSFKTSGVVITKQNIQLRHSNGIAHEALTSQASDSPILSFFNAFSGVIYLALIFWTYRSTKIDKFESQEKFDEKFLQRKKPFYISIEHWTLIRSEYIKRLECKYFPNIESCDFYKILNKDRLLNITDNEWRDLIQISIVKLSEVIKNYFYEHPYRIRESLAIAKPHNYPENKWNELLKYLNEKFIAIQMQNSILNNYEYNRNSVLNELRSNKEDLLPEYRVEYMNFLTTRYYNIVKTSILSYFFNSQIEYLDSVDLTVLNQDQQDELKALAYGVQLAHFNPIIDSKYSAEQFLSSSLPKWLAPNDVKAFTQKANDYVELSRAIEKHNTFVEALNDIISHYHLKSKPSVLSDKEWESVKVLEDKISNEFNKIKENWSAIDQEQAETSALKNKVTKQLDIIDRILKFPSDIDKIETYNNPFVSGNFENLQKLCEYMKEMKKQSV